MHSTKTFFTSKGFAKDVPTGVLILSDSVWNKLKGKNQFKLSLVGFFVDEKINTTQLTTSRKVLAKAKISVIHSQRGKQKTFTVKTDVEAVKFRVKTEDTYVPPSATSTTSSNSPKKTKPKKRAASPPSHGAKKPKPEVKAAAKSSHHKVAGTAEGIGGEGKTV